MFPCLKNYYSLVEQIRLMYISLYNFIIGVLSEFNRFCCFLFILKSYSNMYLQINIILAKIELKSTY